MRIFDREQSLQSEPTGGVPSTARSGRVTAPADVGAPRSQRLRAPRLRCGRSLRRVRAAALWMTPEGTTSDETGAPGGSCGVVDHGRIAATDGRGRAATGAGSAATAAAGTSRVANDRAAGRLRRERGRPSEHPARQRRHRAGPGQRDPARTHRSGSPGPRSPSTSTGKLRGRGAAADGHAYGRGRGARCRGQRRALPARSRARAATTGSTSASPTSPSRRPIPAAAGRSSSQGKNAPYDLNSWADGRLAFYVNGKFGEDWKLTASADTREGAGRGPVHQLPRQVARCAVPAHRSRLLLSDLRRRRHGRGDGADPRQVLRQARARARTTRSGATSRSATWTTSSRRSTAASTAATSTTSRVATTELRRTARRRRRLRGRARHGAEPRGVPRHRRLALLPAPPGHPDRLRARVASRCGTRPPGS